MAALLLTLVLLFAFQGAAVAVFRMLVAPQQLLDERAGVRADAPSPVDQAQGRPLACAATRCPRCSSSTVWAVMRASRRCPTSACGTL